MLPAFAYFYRDLPEIASFAEVASGHLFSTVPPDWWIVVADIEGSTKAIEAGAYKTVNTVGVACIAAVVNVDRSISVPFVFGGDGATFAIPEEMRERAIVALRGAQQLARASFGLALRVGLVAVADLQEFGVKVAKVRLSSHVTQAALSGGGWDEAERRVKSPRATGVLRVEENEGQAEASFEGFECRWQGVPSFRDHKLALLVAATATEPQATLSIYQAVLAEISRIYGDVADYHPLRAERLRLTFNPRLLSHEWRVRSSGQGWKQRCAYFVRMLLQNVAGAVLFSRNMDTESTQWSHYRDELVENSDFRKFDGVLRMVLDSSNVQTQALRDYLQQEHAAGRVAYGMHESREALVTCIVQSYNGNHMHFVDGGDGGYALAAKALKRQLSAQA